MIRLKQDFPTLSKKKICSLLGKTRSALYQKQSSELTTNFKEDVVLHYVHHLRKTMSRLGTRKLHLLITPMLAEHNLRVGRDELFDLLEARKLLIRQRKRKVCTTMSKHWMRKYQNRIRDLQIHRPEQVWVSDITYIRMINQWGYLSLITDSYSRKIMGYCFRLDMLVDGCIQALQMAFTNRLYPQSKLIHHSDRGSQYCSAAYTTLLHDHAIEISMTENGDPYENAIAERVNGILKTEFLLYESRLNYDATNEFIGKQIDVYNQLRPHSSCDMLTPDAAHEQTGLLKKHWKNYRWSNKHRGEKEGLTAPLKSQEAPLFSPAQTIITSEI